MVSFREQVGNLSHDSKGLQSSAYGRLYLDSHNFLSDLLDNAQHLLNPNVQLNDNTPFIHPNKIMYRLNNVYL